MGSLSDRIKIFYLKTQVHVVASFNSNAQKDVAASPLKLSEILVELNRLAVASSAPAPHFIHIYCDKLELTATQDVAYKHILWLRIMASSITVTAAPNKDTGITTLDFYNISTLSIISASLPLFVELKLRQSKTAVPLDTYPIPAIGVSYNGAIASDVQTSPIDTMLPSEVSKSTAKDFAPGTPTRSRVMVDFLNNLFDFAAKDKYFWLGAQSGQKPEDCINSLKLITMMTKGTELVDLYTQAETLWHRLDIPPKCMYYVPSLRPAATEKILKDWCDVAQIVDTAYRDASLKEFVATIATSNSKQIYTSANTILGTIKDYFDTAAKADTNGKEAEFMELQAAAAKASERFTTSQNDYGAAVDTFAEAYKKWAEEKAEQERIDQALACIGVVMDVCVVAYEGPSALINSAAKLTKAAKNLKKSKDLLKGKDWFKRMGELGSKLEKVQSVIGIAKDLLHKFLAKTPNIKKFKPEEVQKLVQELSHDMAATDAQLDWGELKGLWDGFEIDFEDAFKYDIDPLGIDGTAAYHSSMKKFVARGRDLVAAQKEAQTARKKFRQALAYSTLLETKKPEYVQPTDATKVTPEALKVVKDLMDEDMKSTKRWIFLFLHEWVLSVAYLSGLTHLPNVSMPLIDSPLSDVIKKVPEFRTQLLKSQIQSWQEADETLKIDPIRIGTNDSTVFEKDWKEAFIHDGELRFCIPYDADDANPLSYIRTAWVAATGLIVKQLTTDEPTKPPPKQAAFQLQFGPIMTQRDVDKSELTFCSDNMTQICHFDYKANKLGARAVFQADATSDSRNDAVRPCLYSYGVLRLLPLDSKEYMWDVSGVTEIVVTCNVEFALTRPTH